MITFFTYILKWAFCIALLYIPFALLLKKESFSTFNRILLIGIIFLSAILPFITITFPIEIVKFVGVNDNTIAEVHAFPVEQAITETASSFTGERLNWRDIFSAGTLAIIYIVCAAIAFLLRIIEITRIIYSIRHNTLWNKNYNGMTIHCHTGNDAPYSWFSHIVISEDDYNECAKEILLHEEGHYLHKHSWDMLILSAVKSLQWFNPFAYMLANDMKEIHEYEADRHVLEHHGDTRTYQLLLLRKAVGETAFNLANNFSQSSVRKRIMMMARKPSNSKNKGKTFSFIPIILLILFTFAEPEYVYRIIEERSSGMEETFANEICPTMVPPVDCSPLSLNVAKPPKTDITTEKIEAIVAMPLNNKAIKLIERFEVHATDTYYEELDISNSKLGKKLRSANVKQCSVRSSFISDKQGNVHYVTVNSCNISIAGDACKNIEECKMNATEAATEYILSKKWLPAISHGECMNTIYDAYIILKFEDINNNIEFDKTMMAGSTPIK